MTNEHHFWVFGDEPRKFSGTRYDPYGKAGHFIGAWPAQVFLLHRAGQQVARRVNSRQRSNRVFFEQSAH